MIYFTCEEMGHLYSELEYAPKRWLKNELLCHEKQILAQREKIRRGLKMRGTQLALQAELQCILPAYLEYSMKSVAVPTLKAPAFFARPIDNDLKSELAEVLKEHHDFSLIEKIIDRASLNLLTPQFYTLPLTGGYIIYGNPTPTLGNLICFAHEVGHALYELSNPGDELGSEVAAFLFEDEVAALVLKAETDMIDWRHYKNAQDQLNYTLCLNEFEEFKTGVSNITKNLLFFRESLVTCWGYQSIYAWASLKRRQNHEPKLLAPSL